MHAPEFPIASILGEDVSFRELARETRVGGKAIHFGTLARWAAKGIQVGGQRLRLPSLKIGGRRRSSLAALRWFLEHASVVPDPCDPVDKAKQIRSPAEQRRASLQAAERLRRAGVRF